MNLLRVPAVTYILPKIIGYIPNILLPGRQTLPNKNSLNPISLIAGIPLANKNMQMRTTAIIETHAAKKNTILITTSMTDCIRICPSDFVLIESFSFCKSTYLFLKISKEKYLYMYLSLENLILTYICVCAFIQIFMIIHLTIL